MHELVPVGALVAAVGPPARSALRRGFTLLELVVVLAILAAVAGTVLALLGQASSRARVDSLRVSMAALRRAISGPVDGPGFLEDVGEPPLRVADLFRMPLVLGSGAPATPWDLRRRRGWSGPYLLPAGGAYRHEPSLGFDDAYGEAGDPAVLDPWGRPIVLQLPPPVSGLSPPWLRARLVSAGPNEKLETPRHEPFPSAEAVGDDLFVYVFVAGEDHFPAAEVQR